MPGAVRPLKTRSVIRHWKQNSRGNPEEPTVSTWRTPNDSGHMRKAGHKTHPKSWTLKSKDEYLHNDTANQASILNKQFQTVYPQEDLDSLPSLGPSQYPTMNDIIYTEREILNY
jgi:hypothetical protein